MTPRRPRFVVILAAASALAAFRSLAPAASVDASVAVAVRNDVQYGVANGKPLLLDAYVPGEGATPRPAVIMIHGGGWRVGDKASWAEEANRFADHGWAAFSINYRLDEPSAFPSEIDDAQAAVRWVRAHAGEYGVDPQRIAALGESAGGHLTAMLATLGSGPLDSDARIKVGVAWSPPSDLGALARSRGDGWAAPLIGCTFSTCPDRLAEASPVTHVDSSDAPLYLVNSTEEIVPLSQAQALDQRLQAAGVDHRLDVFPGNRHALDYRQDAWAPTLAFLEQHLAGPAPGASPAPARARSSSPAGGIALAAVVVALATAVGLLLRRRSPGAGVAGGTDGSSPALPSRGA